MKICFQKTVLEDSENRRRRNAVNPVQTRTRLQILENCCTSVSSRFFRNMINSLNVERQRTLTCLPASRNPQEFGLFLGLLKRGYLFGKYHIEEITFMENIRPSKIFKMLDNFQGVLFTDETVDPIVNQFLITF